MPDLSIRRMNENDVDRVLEWRNHPDVRRYMYTQHIIEVDEHRSWFARAAADKQKNLLIFELDSQPVGFASINLRSQSKIGDWGFYLAPEAEKGTGFLLGKSVLTYAFDALKLHKICGEALTYNERSIKFHRRLGFQEEGTLREHYFDGTKYHDVVYFGLLSREWTGKHGEPE